MDGVRFLAFPRPLLEGERERWQCGGRVERKAGDMPGPGWRRGPGRRGEAQKSAPAASGLEPPTASPRPPSRSA